MAGREEGYYGPSPEDVGRGAVIFFAFLAVCAVMVAALCLMSLGDEAGGAGQAGSSAAAGGLAADVADERAMHAAGLPTEADVLAWHLCGRWAFCDDAGGVREVRVFHDLPGGALAWDALYGIDPDDPAFEFGRDAGGPDGAPLSEE